MMKILEKAPDMKVPACHILAGYYYGVGDTDSARRHRFVMEDAADELSDAAEERATLNDYDKFLPHDLGPDVVRHLRDRLASTRENVRGYLVRKKLRHHPEIACYILAIEHLVPWWRMEDTAAVAKRRQDIIAKVMESLSVACDLRVYVVGRSTALSRIRKTKGSSIYPA